MRKGLLLCALLSALVGCENLGDALTDDLTTTFTFYDTVADDETEPQELVACSYQIGTVLPADSLPKKSLKRGYLAESWLFYQKKTASGTSYDLPPNVEVENDDPYKKGVVTSVTVTSIPLSFQVANWKPIRYTIVFDGNGGKIADGEDKGKQSYEQLFKYDEYKDKDEALLANKFERAGYKFNGWNIAEHKDWTNFDFENEYVLEYNFAEEDDAVVTLYACWLPEGITIKFASDGDTGTMTSQELSFDDLPTQLNKNTFTRTGWNFSGWKTAAGATFADEQDITSSDYETLCASGANGSVTLTAVWNPRCVVSSSQGFKDTDMTATAEGFTFTAPFGSAYQWTLRSGEDTAVLRATGATCTISYAEYENNPADYTLVVTVFDASGVPTQTCWAKFQVNSQK
ncbi:MAG: InlB B-repeat-containing protein [Treponemataceae bacterium]|nr:InlB B-repeat-containing protein [Treponemataceae bacterium]